jgi:hypothetical protein
LGTQLKHEVGRKTAGIAFDGAVQCTCLNAVELGEVVINQDFFMTHRTDQLGQVLRIGQHIWRGVFL